MCARAYIGVQVKKTKARNLSKVQVPYATGYRLHNTSSFFITEHYWKHGAEWQGDQKNFELGHQSRD